MKKGDLNIKSIVFDVSGVLALGESSKLESGKLIPSGVHTDIAKKLKISLDQYLDAIDTTYALAIEGKISPERVVSTLSKNFKISEKKVRSLYINSYKKHFKQNEWLFNQASKLKKLGYNVSVLSDQWVLSKKALMPPKLYKNFDDIIVSCDAGMRKPNPEIFKLLIKKIGVKPKNILFIDNQVWNTKPASKLGINTIVFKDNKQLFKQPVWKNLFLKAPKK